ncbi:hypothetical protein BaLi_c10820 [Bacillus paralicheniformis ATCC 9945a]|nr:hypothetical protein BaLi_c10820 [Bacillus paralicheniformis ATCC 9945a]
MNISSSPGRYVLRLQRYEGSQNRPEFPLLILSFFQFDAKMTSFPLSTNEMIYCL